MHKQNRNRLTDIFKKLTAPRDMGKSDKLVVWDEQILTTIYKNR